MKWLKFGPPLQIDYATNYPTRSQWLQINDEFQRIFANTDPQPQYVFAGRVAGDGTGDTSQVALQKVIDNLRRIK